MASCRFRFRIPFCCVMVVIIICLLCKMIIIVIPTISFGSNTIFPSETSHVETENNIRNSSRKQTFKEVKKVFYGLLREYRRRKRVPVLLSNNSKLSGTFHELFPKCRRGLFLLIMVPSRPSALNNRNAIRLSWANATHGKLHQSMDHGRTNFTYNVIFVMGRSIRNEVVAEESRRFGDILLLNYEDKNSKLVQTIQSLKRIALTCSPIFFLKTDNDTFINVNAVAEWLTRLHPNIQHAEKLATESPDIGDSKDVSREGHQATGYYGAYVTERSYILAGKIMKNISEASTKIPAMANENAYIRTLVNFLGIKPRELQDPRFMPHVFENVKIRDFDPCDWRKKIFIHHVSRVKHILMHSKTVVFSKLAHLCKDEHLIACSWSGCVVYTCSDINKSTLKDMSLKSRVLWPISLIVVAMMIENCGGIVFFRGPLARSHKSRRKTLPSVCRFDKRNVTVGHTWHPYLEPQGFNFCITCKCQKNGLTLCERTQCKEVTCPGKKIPPGKCCPVCPNSVSQKSCRYKRKRYNPGQVWRPLMENQDKTSNNCAECICYNGHVSCVIRICPKLMCSKVLQVKERDSCCLKCPGFPLLKPKTTAQLEGSCLSNGCYYKNMELWNPLTPTSEMTLFQRPNCRLCSCQNANVTCGKLRCPKLMCLNPVNKNPKDCCKSCPPIDKKPFVLHGRLMPTVRPTNHKGHNHSMNCTFLNTTYQHNSSFMPRIPEIKTNYCVHCTCLFSRVKCRRGACKNGGNCAINCSRTIPPRQRECSGERVQIYLLINGGSSKLKPKQANQKNYVVKIALLYTKDTFIKIHHWNVADRRAGLRTSKVKKIRFARRKAFFTNLGETKIGRINRFFNKEKLLAKCNRNCKNKAQDFVNALKSRVRYLTKSCRPADTFKSLVSSPS